MSYLNSIKNYGIFLVIALFVGAVLLSNKAGVNLTHHHNLPMFAKQKIVCTGTFTRVCHVRMTTAVGDPEKYRDFLHILATAKKGDTIYMYLIGNGGQVRTLVQITNAIKSTKGKVIAVVQGSVYSAHAALATAAHGTRIGDSVLFLFHRSSLYGQEEARCKKFVNKKDRKQDMFSKCINFVQMHLKKDEQFIRTGYGKYLTQAELRAVLEGYDVIITGEEMNRRLNNKCVLDPSSDTFICTGAK